MSLTKAKHAFLRISSYLSPSLIQARRGIPYLRWSPLWGRALHHRNRHRPTTYTWSHGDLSCLFLIQFTRWVSTQHNTTNPAPNKVERCILIYPGSSFVWLASLRTLTHENGWHHVTISDLQKTTIKKNIHAELNNFLMVFLGNQIWSLKWAVNRNPRLLFSFLGGEKAAISNPRFPLGLYYVSWWA